jgi:uncharacterized membrane protein
MRVNLPGLYIALGLVLAGLIHIVAVLSLPLLAPRNAQARLAELGPVNTMIQLPAPAPGRQVMPMIAPDVRYATCAFDLANGPVRVRARGAGDLWFIAFYTPEGDNFYTVTGSDMKTAEIDMVISTADQIVAEADVDAPEALDNIVVVNSPTTEGIVLIRAPMAGPSGAARAEQALKATSCGPHSVARSSP